jgi:tetratricopeptide (TPR) repeat protein
MVHVYAGNLLMTTGAYQDAIKAFINADTVEKTAVAAFQRARCYCALTDLENAKMQFKLAL